MKHTKDCYNEMELSYLTKYDSYLDWKIIWKHLEKDPEGKTIIDIIYDRFPKYKSIAQFNHKLNKIFSKITSSKSLKELKEILNGKERCRIVVSLTRSRVKLLLDFNLNKKEIIFHTILSRKMQDRIGEIIVGLKEAVVFGLTEIEEEILACIDEGADFSCGKSDFFVEMCVDELFAFVELGNKVIEIDE